MANRCLVVDGTSPEGPDLGGMAGRIAGELEARGAKVLRVTLRDEKLMHCRGCFGCWLETPGLCTSQDASSGLLRKLLESDEAVLVSEVTAGGYASTMKRFVDHWVQVALPFFVARRGELHHPLRYARFPRIVSVGVDPAPAPERTRLFQTLAARNAINFPGPSWSAGVVAPDAPSETLGAILQGSGPAAAALGMPEGAPWRNGAEGPGRVLLLVGSPKVNKPSTSAVLGNRVLDQMASAGWEGQTLTLTPALLGPQGREELFEATRRAELILLAFPLYIDALPHLATRTLEVLRGQDLRGKALAAVINSGFPEARQNVVAAGICARFAAEAGLAWAGALALGAGEALCGGEPILGRKGSRRPPVDHVVQGLDLAAAALASGRQVPPAASALLARTPIPFMPSWLWRRMFAVLGGRNWKRMAAKGVDLHARPLDRVRT
jgi:multimeric flavodoxin WrbA